MRPEHLPALKTIYQALEGAAVDIYGFAVVCQNGATWTAEPLVLDSLLLSLENFWLVDGPSGQLSHQEFREEIFKAVWEKCRENPAPVRVGTDVPLGHDEMAFYQLPQMARAALYLRTKKRFAYASIALILGSTESLVRNEVERAREFLLGRRLRAVEFSEDDF